MKNKYLLIPLALLAGLFMGAVGDTLTSLMIQSTSGVIQNKQTLTHSNAFRVVSAPSVSNDVVRWQDLVGGTNAVLASAKSYTDGATNAVIAVGSPNRIAVSNGFGTNTTLAFPVTTGLTNTLGFFLGGNGTIGTNGSTSVLTINMNPVINGTLTNNGGGFFGGNMTFGTNNSASTMTINMTQTNVGQVVMRSNLTVNGTMSVSNISLAYPQWVDIPVFYAFSSTGPSAPALTAVSGGAAIQLLGFDNTDLIYGIAQMPHNIAVTNAANPTLYYEPHVHFSVVTPPTGANSNVTWRLIWQYANLGQAYGTAAFTNTVTYGVGTSNVQYLAEFGHFTNNNLGITGIFRCRLDRPASPSNDYGNTHDVLLNGFDIHVPIANFTISGSRTDTTQ